MNRSLIVHGGAWNVPDELAKESGAAPCKTRILLVGRELEPYERLRGGERQLVRREFQPEDRRLDASEEEIGPMGTIGAVAVDPAPETGR